MAKKNDVLSILAWLVGIFVSLAVGFGMVGEALIIPYIPGMLTIVAGWVVVATTLLGVVLGIVKKLS